MERTLLTIAALFFGGAFILAFWSLKRGAYRASRWDMLLMGGGFLCQNAFLYLRGKALGGCPISTAFELLIFVAWAMVCIYFIIGTSYRLSLLGAFTSPVVFFAHLAALVFLQETVRTEPGGRGFWQELHASVSLVAYGAFALAGVAGVMFLVQDRQLKKHKVQSLFYQLPPVRYLTKVTHRLLLLGFILLSIGIATAYKTPAATSSLKLAAVWAVWGIYAGVLIYDRTRGMSATRAARAAVVAFLPTLLSLWLISKH